MENNLKENLYEIEKIVNKKIDDNNETQYEIKWKNFEENTWQKLSILIEDKAFDSIIEFEKTSYAKSLKMNYDTLNFIKVFEEYTTNNIKFNSKYGDFPFDEPLEIIKVVLDEGTNEKFAFIKWKQRFNGFQPENSYVNVKVVICFSSLLYFDFLKNKIKNVNLLKINL